VAGEYSGRLDNAGERHGTFIAMNGPMDHQLHHQTVQRALALGRSTDPAVLPELACLIRMPSAEVRRLAASAIGKLAPFGAEASAAVQALAQEGARHRCVRCGREITVAEHTRSQQAFQRTFCDSCFDEVFLDRRNFDTKIELNKSIRAKAGTLVQSDGERLIADWLAAHQIAYR
jgi:hypothetical protein